MELLEPYRAYTIWEPCCGGLAISNELESWGYKVHSTDLHMGEQYDFLTMPLPVTDPPIGCIVTNPPYSLVTPIMERCYEHNVQFHLLLPVQSLGGKRRQELYKQHGISITMLGGRVNFRPPFAERTSPSLEACWFSRYGEPLNFVTLKDYGNTKVEPVMNSRQIVVNQGMLF